MAISINCATKVIYVPKTYLTEDPPASNLYELDVDQFRLELKDWEDSDIGMAMPDTHRHNTTVTLSGVIYARTFEIINGYTVEFENGTYSVKCVGANHNLGDVKVVNSVSLIIGNSAGMVVTTGGAGASAAEIWQRNLEGNLSAEEMLRVILAALAGKNTGVGTSNEKYKSQDELTDRIDVTFDGSGNRTTVTLNPS
jgi:hypothetical protein